VGTRDIERALGGAARRMPVLHRSSAAQRGAREEKKKGLTTVPPLLAGDRPLVSLVAALLRERGKKGMSARVRD
jgi:hypothetical protein